MGEIIISEDYSSVIAHYENRFHVVQQYLEDAAKELKASVVIAEEGWHGKAGDAAKDKMLELCREIDGADGEIDGALEQLRLLRNGIEDLIQQMLECIPEEGCK